MRACHPPDESVLCRRILLDHINRMSAFESFWEAFRMTEGMENLQSPDTGEQRDEIVIEKSKKE